MSSMAELVENLRELHRWQGLIPDKMAKFAQSNSSSHPTK